VVARTTGRIGIAETISQTLVMAWRALKKMRRNPEQFFDVTLQPLLFTAMFAFIFGGAIAGKVSTYLPILIPGIVAQTVLTTCMATGVQLREDMEKGVFDRFKALPMARIAPLAGPMVADLVRYLIAASLTFLTGVASGPASCSVTGARPEVSVSASRASSAARAASPSSAAAASRTRPATLALSTSPGPAPSR
jgi:ABC-2 type transport system permease protein